MNEALLPCPFCGGTPAHFQSFDLEDYFGVSCSACGAQGPCDTVLEKAVDAWNKRAALHADQARDARIQALEEAAKACEDIDAPTLSGCCSAEAGFEVGCLTCIDAVRSLAQATQPVPGGKELP